MTTIIDSDVLTTAYSLSTSSCDDVDNTLCNTSLTATSLSTTLSCSSQQYVYAEEASRFVESLSVEELAQFDQLLSEKEETILEKSEAQKVYKKASMHYNICNLDFFLI